MRAFHTQEVRLMSDAMTWDHLRTSERSSAVRPASSLSETCVRFGVLVIRSLWLEVPTV